MTRPTREVTLATRAARERLKPSGKPYFRTLDQGLHLGYRKGTRGAAWVMRWYIGNEMYKVESLDGRPDDVLEADGATVLNWTQAQAEARKLFGRRQREAIGLESEPRNGPYSVADAARDYLAHYKAGHTKGGGKAARDTQSRVDAFIVPTLGAIPLDKLTTKRIRTWQSSVAEAPARLRTKKGEVQKFQETNEGPEAIRRRRATTNRTLNILKAILNHAFEEGKVGTDEAWRRVKPFRETDVAKVRFLSQAEAQRLVNSTAPEIRPLVQAALLSGCRYGELAEMRAHDFEADAGTVTVRASKGGKSRHVVLTDAGVELFKQATRGKSGTALIFTRSDGTPWKKSHQHRPLRAACKGAKISPAASFHILRHTYGSHAVMAGVPLQVVAANLGHADTRMTERHYAHLAPSYVATAIRSAMPSLALIKPDNVTDLSVTK